MTLDDGGMGYVHKCLGSSLWCLREVMDGKRSYEQVMTDLIMEGGDADTNGAVAGAFLGALVGYEQLPSDWKNGLKHRECLRKKVDALCVKVGVQNDGSYDATTDNDTLPDAGRGFPSEEELKKKDEELMKVMRARILKRREEKKAQLIWSKTSKASV